MEEVDRWELTALSSQKKRDLLNNRELGCAEM